MITIITGLPGSAKSYVMAQKAVDFVHRNQKWHKQTGIVRPIYSNLAMSKEFVDFANRDYEFFRLWEDPEELPNLKNADVIWEEMGAHVDSRGWEHLPLTLRRWLQQHRHRGVEIVGNCQDFSDIDVAIRRLTGTLIYLMKLVGSRDPSPTSKPVKFVWGIVLKLELDARNYDDKAKFKGSVFAGFEFLTRKGVDLYSMFNDVKQGRYPALRHRERVCNECNYKKVVHI